MFAFIVTIGSFFIAFILAKVFKIRIREHDIRVDREWRDWRPANPFKFPWNITKLNNKAASKKKQN